MPRSVPPLRFGALVRCTNGSFRFLPLDLSAIADGVDVLGTALSPQTYHTTMPYLRQPDGVLEYQCDVGDEGRRCSQQGGPRPIGHGCCWVCGDGRTELELGRGVV